MKVLIIGSNGKVGKRLATFLTEEQYPVRAMVRKAEQMKDFEQQGLEAFLADLEEDFASAYEGMDIVIFTAGSGSHTGPDKTIAVDQEAAIRSIQLAKKYGIKRYIMVSAQGAMEPEAPSAIQHYYRAKHKADEFLIHSGVPYTLFRPGRLTEEKGSGKIQLSSHIASRGETSRDNLARTITRSLHYPNTENKILEILDGNDPIEEALQKV